MEAASASATPEQVAATPSPAPAASPVPAPIPAPTRYYAEIHPGPSEPLPNEFAAAVKQLEAVLGCPVWMLIQNGEGPWSDINPRVFRGFRSHKSKIAESRPVALILDSPGGDAQFAYQIARLFQRRANGFSVLIPQWAKSAATLLALGASNIVLGRDAELGPLDVQIFDPEREDYDSALNAVQSLERLNAFSLTAIDQAMQLLMGRTRKKSDTLLPLVLEYAANFLRPLLEKIDTVDYTKKSRDLKVAEQYAVRLMRANYSAADARRIASHLVEKYSTHGFVIDREEAKACEQISHSEWFGLGLKVGDMSKELDEAIEQIIPFMDTLTVAGRVMEVKGEATNEVS